MREISVGWVVAMWGVEEFHKLGLTSQLTHVVVNHNDLWVANAVLTEYFGVSKCSIVTHITLRCSAVNIQLKTLCFANKSFQDDCVMIASFEYADPMCFDKMLTHLHGLVGE